MIIASNSRSFPRTPRFDFAFVVTAIVALTAMADVSRVVAADQIPGLVSTQPASGPFVKTAEGFMVPYTLTIPGTEIQFDMIPVPAGTLTMGSPDDEAERQPHEGPQIQVQIEPYWIGKHEVTWSEYRRFMQMYDLFKGLESRGQRVVNDDNRTDAVTAPTPLYDPSFTFVLGEEPRQPAVTMSHFAARQYTKWLSLLTAQSYRLPTEAEWEYACRAGTQTAYAFGDDPTQLGEYAWYFENSDEAYHDVGTRQPNPWGLHDMHGNVAEMVLDQFQPDIYQQLAGRPVTVAEAAVATSKMFPHAVRGGSWSDDAATLRSAARLQTEDWRGEDPNLPKSPWWFTDEPALRVGFRLLRTLQPPSDEWRKRAWEIDNEPLQMSVEGRLTEGRGVLGLVDPQLAQP